TKAKLSIYADDLMVFDQEVELTTGLNYLSYDLSLREDKVDEYKESLAEKATLYKAADDGRHYLKSGSYQLKLSIDDNTIEAPFEIK
ncbi:MAG: hypothetical protein AAFR14_06265, partial [Bacteroidota bacterium]